MPQAVHTLKLQPPSVNRCQQQSLIKSDITDVQVCGRPDMTQGLQFSFDLIGLGSLGGRRWLKEKLRANKAAAQAVILVKANTANWNQHKVIKKKKTFKNLECHRNIRQLQKPAPVIYNFYITIWIGWQPWQLGQNRKIIMKEILGSSRNQGRSTEDLAAPLRTLPTAIHKARSSCDFVCPGARVEKTSSSDCQLTVWAHSRAPDHSLLCASPVPQNDNTKS